MADTLQPDTFRALRHTPLRDLARGRVTGRLDWRRRIDAAQLPAPIAEVIRRVVKRTRLWRLEKAEVADEMITHFADGLASGEIASTLVADFGDPKTAAKLIRRAKRRNRPLVLRWLRYVKYGLGVFVALYAVAFARFWFGQPTIPTNYLSTINAEVAAVPVDQRGWPLYRQALIELDLGRGGQDTPLDETVNTDLSQNWEGTRLIEAVPEDKDWPRLAAWLNTKSHAMSVAREAAAKPSLGVIYGRWPSDSNLPAAVGNPIPDTDTPLNMVASVHINALSQLIDVLRADIRLARSTNDSDRLCADVETLHGIAMQMSRETFNTFRMHLTCEADALDCVRETLETTPALLTDDQLIRLAHRFAQFGGDTAALLINYKGERLEFADAVQRLYSDNGFGDGVITAEGLEHFPIMISPRIQVSRYKGGVPWNAPAATAMSAISSRKAALAEFDRLTALMAEDLQHPLREVDRENGPLAQANRRLKEIEADPKLIAYYFPLSYLLQTDSFTGAERTLGEKEGVLIAIALELYRRQHGGQYPATLDALSPTLLPRLPVDRITGEALKYRVIDGKPVIYSVGVDRDDDGGRAGADSHGKAFDDIVARWPRKTNAKTPTDGDWILFDGRRTTATRD